VQYRYTEKIIFALFSATGRQADEFPAKLSNKKFRVCGFWKGQVQNIAIISAAPEVILCNVIPQVKFAHAVQVRRRPYRDNNLDHTGIAVANNAKLIALHN
jgi:hypothetical protein